MVKLKFLTLFVCVTCFISCKPSVNSGELYGKWDYIKIEHPQGDHPDIPADELK
jgi:hypothetical protein